MAKHWRMLLLPGFSDCSWTKSDVDRGWSVSTGNVLKRANLHLERYFRALYVPLGGSKTRMENTPSMEFYISMFSDKPPFMPPCFGIAVIILSEAARAFSFFISFFLAYAAGAFSLLFLASSSTFSSFLSLFFFLLS